MRGLGRMVLTWGGRRPSGGAPAPPWDGPLLGWDAGVLAGEDPVAISSGDLGPAPSSWRGQCGAGSEKPHQGFPGGHTHHMAAPKSTC